MHIRECLFYDRYIDISKHNNLVVAFVLLQCIVETIYCITGSCDIFFLLDMCWMSYVIINMIRSMY